MRDTQFARVLAGLAVLAVAVIAAIVSYSHIDALALSHGYSPDTAHLLPLSVDGLILASSLVLLVEAQAQHPAPRLARAGLWTGIVATLAANVLHGVAYGLVGAATNAWPAVGFVFASEILMGMLRRGRSTQQAPEAGLTVADLVPGMATVPVLAGAPIPGTWEPDLTVPDEDIYPDIAPDTETVSETVAGADAEPVIDRTPRRTLDRTSTAGKVASLRARYPDMTQQQMAARLKVSERTVRRHLAGLQTVPE